jgi:hypothetical protein
VRGFGPGRRSSADRAKKSGPKKGPTYLHKPVPASGFRVGLRIHGYKPFSPVVGIHVVLTNLKAFGVIDKPRLLAYTLNSGSGIILSSIDADQLFVIITVVEFVDVPQQEHFIHREPDQITAGCGKYVRAQKRMSRVHGTIQRPVCMRTFALQPDVRDKTTHRSPSPLFSMRQVIALSRLQHASLSD